MSLPSRVALSVLVVGSCWPVSQAAAQRSRPPRTWEIEVHGGGVFGNNPTAGTPIAQFPTGAPLPTLLGATTTRAVSSWYFGDGAQLINQVNASFGVSPRLTPLDEALKKRLADRDGGFDVGFRVARGLTPRLAAEFSFDYSPSALRMTPEAVDAVEAARSSFISAWSALLATGATTNRNVTSTSEVREGDGHQMSTTLALNIRFRSASRLRPYATAGGGGVFYRGKLPEAALNGNYNFLFGGLFPMDERDIATVTVRSKDRVLVGLLGGGVEYDLSRRHGVRADVRMHLSGNSVDTLVSANPAVTQQSPVFAVSTPFNPGIQFSNSQLTNRRSSLSGPAVVNLETFKGSGTQMQGHLTIGYFFRF